MRTMTFDPDSILTRREILSSGVRSRALTEMVRAGVVARIGRGIYRTGANTMTPDPHGISRSMRAAISHESAAAWYGADLPYPPTLLHVTAPRDRGRRVDCMRGVRLHRADLHPGDLAVVRGARITTPLRTVSDVAHSQPLAPAVAIADSLCRLGLVHPAEIERAAAGLLKGPGRPAVADVARLLDPRAESVFESISRVTMAVAGVPAPVSQLDLYDGDGGWLARVYFAWPDHKIVLECDGFEFHQNREAFERDRRRWSALTRAGWRVIVVTWRDVLGDPDYLVELVGDLIRTAA